MKSIMNAAIAALFVATGATASQAQEGQIVWHYPPKGGAPYATRFEPTRNVAANETMAKRTLHYVKIAKKPHNYLAAR